MSKTRMEAFRDGVVAIIVTVMVLEIKAPRGPDLAALCPLNSGVEGVEGVERRVDIFFRFRKMLVEVL